VAVVQVEEAFASIRSGAVYRCRGGLHGGVVGTASAGVRDRDTASPRLEQWKKRALYASIAFFLSCAAVSPFLYGQPLHSHWESFGKYLVLLSMALLLPFVYCVTMTFIEWNYLRNLGKIET
jgi:hypothetical protein